MKHNQRAQPTDEILEAFGITEKPILLFGGQGTSYACGNIVVKPEEDLEEAGWISQIFSELEIEGIRIPKPIQTTNHQWVYKGWSAHVFVDGETTKNRWEEKIQICRKFHKAIAGLEKPDLIGKRTHPWEIADRMIWGETIFEYGAKLQSVISRLEPLLQPINLKSQIIHGDMSGNILFHSNQKPAIIDFSPYWHPSEYAVAIIIIDAIVWENAPISLIEELEDTIPMNQLLVRACMWRIKTTEEFIRQYGGTNINDVLAYHSFIDALLDRKNL